MEIKRIGENKIRCALTEEEIRDMGFEIDDIIGDGQAIQKFMKVVLRRVEQEEDINMDDIAPVVRAELLPDHSMAITFGGDADMSFKDVMDSINRLLSHVDPEKIKDFSKLTQEEKQSIIKDFLHNMEEAEQEPEKLPTMGEAFPKPESKKSTGKKAREPMTCVLRFCSMDEVIDMSRGCFNGNMPKSSLYKMESEYYLVLDFTGIAREETRAFACRALEYDHGHYSNDRRIAYIKEHGTCIMKKDAIEMLKQL